MRTKTIQTVIIVVLGIAVFMAGAAVYALNQPKFLSGVVLSLSQNISKDLIVKEISMDQVRWSGARAAEFKNVRIKCKIKKETFFLSAGSIYMENLKAVAGGEPLNVQIRNLAVVSDELNMSDIQAVGQVYFKGFKYQRVESSFTSSRMEWNKYLAEDVRGDLKDEQKKLSLAGIQAKVYGGRMFINGYVHYDQKLSYNIDIQLKNVDSSRMAEANESFAQVTAVFEGGVNVKDEGKGILLKADLQAPSGGGIKASLLRFLVQYVPQRKQVEDLIAKGGDVSLSKIQGKITSIGPEQISSEVILNSSSLNLNMDVKFDINMDGGIAGLLEYFRT